jgi:hypothetical protein
METARIEFEPFINEGVRQFIVNGVDYYNIALLAFPTISRSTSSCVVSAVMCLAGCSASSGEAGCR